MLKATIIQISIACPYDRAYAFLSDPLNYPRVSPMPGVTMEPADDEGLAFVVELPNGRATLRYTEPNPYGVLDYTVIDLSTKVERTTPLRLVRNDDGCELVMVFFQRTWVDDQRFASDVDWTRNDLQSIKSLLEAL
jgi:hypothetical protein